MSKKTGLKLPRRLQMKATAVAKPQPVTAEDSWVLGTEEEESGDRWLASDLAKALRFYFRAYEHYRVALSKDDGYADALYNTARLLLHVHNQFVRQEGIILDSLESVEAAREVIQPLERIVEIHEHALSKCRARGVVPWELVYNTAMAYSELVEKLAEDENNWRETLESGIKARDMFSAVLGIQREELKKLVDISATVATSEAASENLNNTNNEPSQADQGENYMTEETVLPDTILETVTQCYKLVGSVYETTADPNRLSESRLAFQSFSDQLDNLVAEVNISFAPSLDLGEDQLIPRITTEALERLKLERLAMLCSQSTQFEEISAIWMREENTLADSAEKHMVYADCIQTLMDKFDNIPDHFVWWTQLSTMLRQLQIAAGILTTELGNSKGKDIYSQMISQLCAVIIARADIEKQRSQLETSDAAKNRELLLKNCTQLLKNAGNYASMSGGLREGMTDRLVREKRKREAILRLCLLENKSLASLKLSENDFQVEITELAKLSIY
ncbi:unnamed protein product [Kuraishia capsulata CBS 1993]|uniref:Uncharacterized protein n=1 Tax=Kuraishia capsulata CBS 1993 TaxID=1382522 RepID=W6MS58_9ASCO|nr:uncharacterized protein KUCA_T00000621001 [Kuraishia capsulata CBS 1993]CDK24655.1 unnamed protein product [Kuraishia capsulata CBS 1993]